MAKITSKISLAIKIENNKFASNLPMVSEILKAHNNQTIDVTFARRKNKRTNHQNRYWFGVIVPIFQNCIKETWAEIYSTEQVHEFLKSNCNYIEIVNEETGQIVRRTKSTTENDTVAQETMHELARQLAYEFFNTTIPLPNEGMEIDLDFNR